MAEDPARFQDRGDDLGAFADEILVHCPRCDGRASVVPDASPDDRRYPHFAPRRLTCPACGFADRRSRSWTAPLADPNDPYFEAPLWLTTHCRGHVLWAYNTEHLDLLEAFVTARLRERKSPRGGHTLITRLPTWIKRGNHRTDVLNAIHRLHAMAA